MKRLTLRLLGLALGVTATASAQGLTMQMSNGWSFSFAGNVNAFWVFSKATQGGPTNSSVRTGLLPSFATFEARGKESGMNLAVHFGFSHRSKMETRPQGKAPFTISSARRSTCARYI